MSETLRRLSDAGLAIWIDGLTRPQLRERLADLVRDDGVVGAVTGAANVQRAVAAGAYDDQLAALARRQLTADDAVREIIATDAREAGDALRGVYEATGGLDGHVSVELDGRVACDAAPTVVAARQLWSLVDRPNVLVSIPATDEGLRAVTAGLGAGICVHATLIFSAGRHRAAVQALLAGLDLARSNGHDVAALASVASFSISQVDTEVDKRLWAIATDAAASLRGKAAVANARMALAAHDEALGGEQATALRALGCRAPRLGWSATAARDPYYSDTLYADELFGHGGVAAVSEATLATVADHGDVAVPPDSSAFDEARHTMAALEDVGVDLADVVRRVEQSSLDRHVKAGAQLLGSVEKRLLLQAVS